MEQSWLGVFFPYQLIPECYSFLHLSVCCRLGTLGLSNQLVTICVKEVVVSLTA